MAIPPDRGGPFYPRLESLRGLAGLIVAAMHSAQAQSQPGRLLLWNTGDTSAWELLAAIGRVAINGWGAVVAFFVLSGFVLSLALDRGPIGLGASARRFFTARVLRLYPAPLVSILLFVVAYQLWSVAIPRDPERYFSLRGVIVNALVIEYKINGVLWTVQVELLAAPFIFAVHHLRRRLGEPVVWVVALSLVVLLFTKTWGALVDPYIRTLDFAFAFAFGMLVPTLGRGLAERLAPRAAALLAATVVLWFFVGQPLLGPASKWTRLFEGLASAVFIALVVYGPSLRGYRVLDFRPVLFFGAISYSFYVFHPLTLLVIWKIPETLQTWLDAGAPPALIALFLTVATGAVVTPLAAASYFLVERPCVFLGRRLGAPGQSAREAP